MDRRATLLAIAIPPLLATAFLLGWVLRGSWTPASPRLGDKVREAAGVIRDRYYGDVPDEKLERATLDGMMGALDPYSQYFTQKDYEDFHSRNIVGNFFGVGILVELDRETGYINVVTPLEDSPAFAADILPGDKLIKVNGEDIKGQSLEDVIGKIKGPEGSKVTLAFWRKSKGTFDVPLQRARITIVAVKSKMAEEAHGIGYVRISDFTEFLPQFDKAVAELASGGMKALVIDLRFNGGGLLESAIELSDRFLPEGQLIVSTRGRGMQKDELAKNDRQDVPSSIPVAILVNGGSASASEVFAGCLKDHARATLVGSRTFGKGSVQTPIPLSDGSRLKITTARYFTPKGTSVHREEGRRDYGLDPDYLVEMTDAEFAAVREFWRQESVLKGSPDAKPKPVRDLQLEAAIEVLSAKIEHRVAKVETRNLAAPVKKEPSED